MSKKRCEFDKNEKDTKQQQQHYRLTSGGKLNGLTFKKQLFGDCFWLLY
jgi:hypothetical protein